MIRSDLLRGLIAQRGISQAKLAEKLGITPKTFYAKMKNRVFGSDEIQAMIDILGITDSEQVVKIFFQTMSPNMQQNARELCEDEEDDFGSL